MNPAVLVCAENVDDVAVATGDVAGVLDGERPEQHEVRDAERRVASQGQSRRLEVIRARRRVDSRLGGRVDSKLGRAHPIADEIIFSSDYII